MDRLTHLGERRVWLSRASIGLLVCGVALSVWALWNVIPRRPTAMEPPSAVEANPVATVSVSPSRAVDTTLVTYPARPKKGDVFGRLLIPRLGQTFPLVQGTGTDELKRGVGHMVRTAMPGEPENCVVSGHRDTVFTKLGNVKKGDLLIIETAVGTFTYRVTRIRIVDKDDRTVVVKTGRAVLTVSTCYPFRYVGSAPDRYVLIADLVANP